MLTIKIAIVALINAIVIVDIFAQKIAQQKIQSYQPCSTDKDCKINSFCFGNDDDSTGFCKCMGGFELIRNATYYECLKGVDIGNPCEKDIECQINASSLAICNKFKLCDCNEDSHNYNGVCTESVKLGEICKTDGNCYINDGTLHGTFAYCVDGRCTCPIGKNASQDGTSCLTTRQLGESCIADEECSLATSNTRCFEECKCALDYTLSRDGSSCVKAATQFGESCDFDAQCSHLLSESICNNKKCGCIQGLHGYGTKCVQTKKIGERCDEDAQCLYDRPLYGNVQCNGTCKCIYGKKSDGSCKLEKSVDNSSAVCTSVISFNILLLILIFFT